MVSKQKTTNIISVNRRLIVQTIELWYDHQLTSKKKNKTKPYAKKFPASKLRKSARAWNKVFH